MCVRVRVLGMPLMPFVGRLRCGELTPTQRLPVVLVHARIPTYNFPIASSFSPLLSSPLHRLLPLSVPLSLLSSALTDAVVFDNSRAMAEPMAPAPMMTTS